MWVVVVISRCVTVGSGTLILEEEDNSSLMLVVSMKLITHAQDVLSCGWSSKDVL